MVNNAAISELEPTADQQNLSAVVSHAKCGTGILFETVNVVFNFSVSNSLIQDTVTFSNLQYGMRCGHFNGLRIFRFVPSEFFIQTRRRFYRVARRGIIF
jgi:hypothetical protein